MRRDQKKHMKQKKREQELADRRRYIEQRERRQRRIERYPKILVDPSNGDPEFVALLNSAVKDFDFDAEGLFQTYERHFYRLMRQYGYSRAFALLREAMRTADEADDTLKTIGPAVVLLGLGTRLLERTSEDARRRLMPFNDVFVEPRNQEFVLKFSSMLSKKGAGGTIYYSRQKLQVALNGKMWNVGFSRHAIQRMCERINPRYYEYAAAGDIHALFSTCIYVEPIQLYPDQPAFIFYDICDAPGFARYFTYVEEILGKDNVDPTKGKCYYRVGYCPVVFEGEFAKAKTFLYPGYSGTPEYGLVVRSSRLSSTDRNLLFQQATAQDATDVILNDNSEAIQWFHNNGIPQVVQMKQEVFVPYSR